MHVDFKATIDKPVSEVYNAIVDCNHMANYFAVGDKDLIAGTAVLWSFGKDGQERISVTETQQDKFIGFTWQATGRLTRVALTFTEVLGGSTQLTITESDWELTEENAKKAMGQMWGWADFFCCLKAYLLFHVNLRSGQQLGSL